MQSIPLRLALFAGFSILGRAATFGTIVAPPGGAAWSDIVIDESRTRLYLVASTVNRVDVYNYKTSTFLAPIPTGQQPVSAALSPDNSTLYVTAYTDALLDIVNLTTNAVSTVSLATNPEGVAVGSDGRVLITAVGTGAATTNTLLIYDPSTKAVSQVPVVPPAATSPVLPTPPGRVYNSYRSRLATSRNGAYIIGVNNPTATTRVVFVYETASGTVLRSRTVANLSTVLAVAADGLKFMAGPVLFDSTTLQVMAQENTANAPFAFPSAAAPGTFNTQANQGGSVFSPDGTVLYGAFNVAPIGAARPSIAELLVNDPSNLLINLGIQMPENLAGKMVINAAGTVIYGLSDSGIMILPVGNIAQSPLAQPSAQSILLTNDVCGAFKITTGSDAMNNVGKGRFTVSVAPYTPPAAAATPPAPGFPPAPAATTSITTPAPTAQANNNGATPAVNFTYNAAASTNPGTIGPSDFTVSSVEAINIPGNIHVYQNYRDSVSSGTIVPVAINALVSEGLTDILLDSARNKIYIANSGLNVIDVYDLTAKAFTTPIKVGQLPIGMAFGTDKNTMYVANAGGESISIVNLNTGLQAGRVVFPALPLNVAVAVSAPVAIATSAVGTQFVMNDGTVNGTLWTISGTQAIPRKLNPLVFGATATSVSGGTATTTAFWTLSATPAGEYVMLYTGAGNAYLYDYTVDDFTLVKNVLLTPLTGYRGPVAAGPGGKYFAVGGTFLDASLTPVAGSTNGFSPSGRPVSAVTALSATQVALFTTPVRATATSAVTDPGQIEIYDPTTGTQMGTVTALEGPSSVVIGNGVVTAFPRTLAVDTTGPAAYVLTATGMSIVALAASPSPTAIRPTVNPGGIVNLADFTAGLAPGGLITVFGKNLGTMATATATTTTPLPTLLGGMCVTLNNTPIPLEMTSPGQINGQIPVTLAAGRYPLVLRSIANQAESASSTITVSQYAPAVLMNGTQASIVHHDGTYVTKDNPAVRDEKLFIYATGLGATKGATIVTGAPAPASPAAVTGTVQVFFGNPLLKQSQMIVNSSVLVPGMVGIDQIAITVPGFHQKGNALAVTLRIGGVNSSVAGPDVPIVAVQ